MSTPTPSSRIKLTFATKNQHKLSEIQALVNAENLPVDVLINENASDVDETAPDFEGNAKLKALGIPPAQGSEWVLSEDTGFVVDGLDGLFDLSPFPGVHSNRWLTPERLEKIIRTAMTTEITQPLRNESILTLVNQRCPENRRAAYVCVMALYHPASNTIHCVTGKAPLSLIHTLAEVKGEGGFGYDPITIPLENNPTQKTTAQMSMAEKNSISHRAKAFKAALEILTSSFRG